MDVERFALTAWEVATWQLEQVRASWHRLISCDSIYISIPSCSLFKSILSPPSVSSHLCKYHSPLSVASFPPPQFSIIIYPRLSRQSIWPLAPQITTMYSTPNPDSMSPDPPPLDTQWAGSHLHSLNQTASELHPEDGKGGRGGWLSFLTASWSCTASWW